MRLSHVLFALWLMSYRALSQSSGGVDLSKEMPGILYGIVSNDSGVAVGERIAAFYIGTDHGRQVAIRACASVTDSEGGYRCDGLSPGDYLVLAMDPFQRGSQRSSRQGAFSFYGNTGDVNKAMLIHLRPRDYQAANFSLSFLNSGYSVRGEISMKTAKAGITLYAVSDSGLECPLPIQTIGNEGTFSFVDLPSGKYRVEASWNEGMNQITAAKEFEIADHDISGISLDPVSTIQIRLSLENSNPWGKTPLGDSIPSDVVLEEINTGATIPATPDKTKIGDFIFPKVKPGTYWLSMDTPSTGCIDSISLGGREVSNPLPLNGDVKQLTMDGSIDSVCGSVRGVLSPAMKSEIVLTTDKFAALRTAASDQNGNFTIRGLPRGEYRVYSWPSLKNIPFRNRSYLRSLQDHSTSVSVSGGESTTQVEVLQMDF